MGAHAAQQRWAGWLLGPDGALRVRSSMALIALVVYALFALLQHGEVMLGLIDPVESNWLTLFNLCGALGFYALVRSGLSVTLAAEPSLTMPQMVFAIVSTSWSYAITGPARGAVISIMILVIMFGMFILQPRHARSLALLAVVLLAAVMLWRSHESPERYPPRVEGVHFLFTAIVLGGTSSLAIRLGKLRARLAAQKNELADALALNRELATRDALTGLLNRRAILSQLAGMVSGARRHGHPLSIGILDLDAFKAINDEHGHHVGDDVLVTAVRAMRAHLRAEDQLGRLGGEEFLMLLPDTESAAARSVAEKLRTEVAVAPAPVPVTVSVGVATWAQETPEELLRRADAALYRAKEGGRDRVMAATLHGRT